MSEQIPPQQNQASPPPYPYPYPPYHPYSNEDKEINIMDYWKILWKWKFLIAGIFIILTASAVIHAIRATPVYRASTLLAPVEADNGGPLSALASRYGGLASLAGIDLSSRGPVSKKNEYLAVLRSRLFTEKFVNDENALPILFPDAWDKDNEKWKDAPPSSGSVYKMFSNLIHVETNRETGFVTLSVEWRDPQMASEWANKMVERLNVYIKEQKVDEATKNMEYLSTQLRSTNNEENRAILHDLIESNTKTIMLANVTDEFAFRVIDPAVTPEERIRPKRKRMVMMGAALGLMLGVGFAFVLNYVYELKEKSGLEETETVS